MKTKSLMTKLIVTAIMISGIIACRAEAKTVDERIYIIPAGNVDKKAVDIVRSMLPADLPMTASVEVLPQEQVTDFAYDTIRHQYGAETILKDIAKRVHLKKSRESALVIVDVDMYSPGLNFVYGIADPPNVIGIISLARLKNEFYNQKPDSELFRQRVLKEATHELGHAWGLPHCSDPKCVMSFSDDIQATDKKKRIFCFGCQKKLKKRYSTPFFDNSLMLM